MINEKIIQLLNDYGLNVNEALTVLLILHYGIEKNNNIMNDDYISHLSYIGIINYDFEKKEYYFNIPLFEENNATITFDEGFIEQYISKFTKINKDRRAAKKSVMERLDKLKKEFPDVTEDEILKAVDIHISRLRDPSYLKQADYFIWKKDEGFNIMKYIEEIRENPDINTNNYDLEDLI